MNSEWRILWGWEGNRSLPNHGRSRLLPGGNEQKRENLRIRDEPTGIRNVHFRIISGT